MSDTTITNLPSTASESEMVAGSYFAMDVGSTETKKLPAQFVAKKSEGITNIHALAAQYAGYLVLDDGVNTGKFNIASIFADFAEEFVDNTTTTVAGLPYMHNGSLYIARVGGYNGAWDATKFTSHISMSGIARTVLNCLDVLKLNLDRGKNLFNKDSSYALAGFYVGYSDGAVHTIADYKAYVIPVGGNEKLSFNKATLNVAAFSVFPDFDDALNGTRLSGYLGGTSTVIGTPWTTPVGTKCLVVSVSDSNAPTLQVEKGNYSTPYESYKAGIDSDKVFGLPDLLAEKLDADRSKNLFNKNTANKKTNAYVDYSTGHVTTLSAWTAYVVEIPDGVTQVSCNKSGNHCAAFDRVPDMPTATGTIAGYLGGVTGPSNQGWTLPAGTKCIVVSCADSNADSCQVESGASSTSYVPYVVGLDWSKIINAPKSSELHVGAGETYTTIQAAVDAAQDYDTIIVHPGTYNEDVNAVTANKFIKIVGVSKDLCILTHSNGNYSTPPLEIAKGIIQNLTIKATGTTLDPGASNFAYCVHIDYDTEANSSLVFEDCVFENDMASCVGIGLRENYTLTFKNCVFTSHHSASPVYCHEQQADNKSGQRLELINCSMYNDWMSGHVKSVTLQESGAYNGNTMTMLIQRCILKTKNGFDPAGKALVINKYGAGTGGEGSGGAGYLGSKGWYLDPLSELNNEAIVNYSEQ